MKGKNIKMIGSIQNISNFYENPNKRENKKRKEKIDKKKIEKILKYNLPVGTSTSIIDIRI